MLRLRNLLLLISILVPAISAWAEQSADAYNATATRAARFFRYREWSSASALYSLLIEMKPDVPANYARSVVALGMIDQPDHQTDITNRALEAHVPLDSIFTNVRTISFDIGQTSLYEKYLLLIKHREPWQARIVDRYLLDYYTFRRDAKGMIEYSLLMLDGLPDDRTFLSSLAQGYLLDGNYPMAIDTYRRIVDIYPDDNVALLYLGNYYAAKASADNPQATSMAIDYLSRAARLAPAPYIESTLARLRDIGRGN